MSIGSLYSLADAKRLLRENRNLITYLIKDRQIPTQLVGRAKVIDETGLAQLRDAVAEYRAKPEPEAVAV